MTQDQFLGFVRQLLPFLAGIAVGHGYLNVSQAADLSTLILQIAGPLFIVGSTVWAFIANSRKSIMAAASKPVAPGVPPPQIVLPKEEKELADALPANVTSKP